jgi:hypothetical protein
MIADEKVGPKGVKVRCKKCGNIISVTKDAASADAAGGAPAAAGAPGSAFDDLFGQNGGAGAPSEEERSPTKVFTTSELNKVREEQALAKGDDQAPASDPAPAAAASTASTKAEWYVAINDEQVGPISDADVQERWDRGQIQATSLAWKAGLPDWAPISQLADLQHLTSRPQQQQAAKPAPVAQPEAKEEEKKEVVTWRPSGASALADLAKEATVEEPKKPEPQAEASPFGNDINLQSPGGGDPFGSPVFAGAASGPSTVWQFPTSTAKKSGGTSKALLGAIAFVGVLLLAGIGWLAVQMMNVTKQQQQTGLQPPPVVTPPPAVTPPPVAVAPTGQPVAPSGAVAALAQPKTDVGTPQATNDKDKGEKGSKTKGKGKGRDKGDKGGDDAPTAAAATPEPKKDTGGGKKDGFDDLLAGKKPASEVKEKLSRDDVLGTVTANKAAILKCANAFANGGGKLPPKLMAKWTIKASGFTENVEMASPELKGTPVDACVVAAIKKWRFPEFRSGEIPVTFPFPISQ